MNKNWLVLLGIMAVIGVVSALLTYLRAANLSSPGDVASKSLASLRKGHLIFYGVMLPLVVGLISFYVYRWMLVRLPANTQTVYLLVAVALAVVFTVLAAVVFKMRGFVEMTALHVLYTAGFGWVMPLLMVK